MQRNIKGFLFVALIILTTASMTFAGTGHGPGDGTGPIYQLYSGTPFAYEGVVVTVGLPGEGIVLAVGSENVTIYGIGPISYWETLGVDRPEVGETIYVEGYTVDFNGVSRNIATSIVVGDIEILLRDPETGSPLWREPMKQNKGNQN